MGSVPPCMEFHGHTECWQSSLQTVLPKLLWKTSNTAGRAKEGQCHLLLTPFPRGGTRRRCVRSLHKRLQTVTFSTDSSNDSSTFCYSFTLMRNEDIFSIFSCFITVYYFLSNSCGLWIIKAALFELLQTENPGDLQNPIKPTAFSGWLLRISDTSGTAEPLNVPARVCVPAHTLGAMLMCSRMFWKWYPSLTCRRAASCRLSEPSWA